MNNVLAFSWSSLWSPPPASTSKEQIKDVHGRVEVKASSSGTSLDSLLSSFIIDLPLLRVWEHLIGHADLLELLIQGIYKLIQCLLLANVYFKLFYSKQSYMDQLLKQQFYFLTPWHSPKLLYVDQPKHPQYNFPTHILDFHYMQFAMLINYFLNKNHFHQLKTKLRVPAMLKDLFIMW